MKKDKRIEREQGDVNTTENRRKYWERHLSDPAKTWFDEDAKYFLHQSLSTPVLNVLSRARGIYIEDMDGKKYIDMHGNGVHNAGYNNPRRVVSLPFLSGRFGSHRNGPNAGQTGHRSL